jgi:acyl transferase domain-containing protein
MTESGIAIVGMACVFPGAGELATFWQNICTGVDAITEMPASGWDRIFYDPTSKAVDRIPCRRGGFIDAHARFDPLRHGVMPVAANAAEPDQLLSLEVAARALEDAGYGAQPPQRTGVVLGRGAIIGPRHARISVHMRTAEQLIVALQELLPGIQAADLAAIKAEFQRKNSPGISAEGVIGLVPNLLASRIAGRFDLSGAAYTVDAACASSLIAVDHSCLELRCDRADLMLCGGVQVSRDEAFWSVFSQLGALSPSERIRPFDAAADGLLIGEGVGVLALRREKDALRDGNRIYAVIRGTGTSSDGKGASLVSPRVEGQLRALEVAWRGAAIEPSEIGLIEAHGTGTPTGDAAEIETLRRFFGDLGQKRVALGSVKSMIGHAMPAAGAAGLIKAALAVYHGIKPTTLHCTQPREDLAATSFRVQSRSERWDESRRIAAVNAFGFGGINAHVIIESARATGRSRGGRPPEARAQPTAGPYTPALYAADSIEALCQTLARDEPGERGSVRLCMLDPTPERLVLARRIAERGRPVHGHMGISFDTRALLANGGSLAVLFPGFDAEFAPPTKDLLDFLGAESFDVSGTEVISRAKLILRANTLVYRALRMLGVEPHAVAGHSLGDMNALVAGGMLEQSAIDSFIEALRPGILPYADVTYVALGCDLISAQRVIEGIDGVVISHDNCPHQVVACAAAPALERLHQAASRAGILTHALPFRIGMHTPYFLPMMAVHAAIARAASFTPPRCAVYSATTAAQYPPGEERVQAVVIDHMVKPVRFRELIDRMYEDGVRVFVQAGSGSLVQFVEDTLRGRPHVAVSASSGRSSGLEQLQRVLCSLWLQGAEVAWERLVPDAASETRESKREDRSTRTARDRSVLLDFSVPFVHFDRPLDLRLCPALSGPAASAPTSEPLHDAMRRNLELLARAQQEVASVIGKRPRGPSVADSSAPRDAAKVARTYRRRISLETWPELVDHSFQRQPRHWQCLEDSQSVVPLTGILGLMVDAVEELLPGRRAIELLDVTAMRLLPAADGVDVEIACSFDGHTLVEVALEPYAKGVVRVADTYPPRPVPAPLRLVRERHSPISARELYADRWMFHGPAYQGVTSLDAVGDNGTRARLRCLPARGALLDCAAQVLGYWVVVSTDHDRMTIPMHVERVLLYGPHPVDGDEFLCEAEVRAIDERTVTGRLVLTGEDGVWARVDGWTGRRVRMDEKLWQLIRWPERSLLCETPEPGLAIFRDGYRDVLTRELLERCYLRKAERGNLAEQHPRDRRSWLGRRIAAKDAIRHLAWSRGAPAIFPIELTLESDGPNGFCAQLPDGKPVWVATDTDGDMMVALACEQPAPFVSLRSSSDRESASVVHTSLHGEVSIGWTR